VPRQLFGKRVGGAAGQGTLHHFLAQSQPHSHTVRDVGAMTQKYRTSIRMGVAYSMRAVDGELGGHRFDRARPSGNGTNTPQAVSNKTSNIYHLRA
jgi:hypothetical protein